MLYISCTGVILSLHLNYICFCILCVRYVCASYNGVNIDMFVHLITVSVLLCLCMSYNIMVVYTSLWYFILYLSGAWVIPPLRHCYIYAGINMFVHDIYIFFTVICLCTSYDIILGCVTPWEYCHAYFLHINCYAIFAILDWPTFKIVNQHIFVLIGYQRHLDTYICP